MRDLPHCGATESIKHSRNRVQRTVRTAPTPDARVGDGDPSIEATSRQLMPVCSRVIGSAMSFVAASFAVTPP